MTICTGVSKVEDLGNGIELLKVTFNDQPDAYMCYNYADSLKFVDQEVVVSFRRDIYQGKPEVFVNNLVFPRAVNTLDREGRRKLYVDFEDNNSNISIDDLADGETALGAVLYCLSSKYDSSPTGAVWLAMRVRDRKGRIATLRMFDYSSKEFNPTGTYIRANVKKSKYGLQTNEVTMVEEEFAISPEISIAKQYIEEYFATDSYITALLQKTQLLDHMLNYSDGDEAGACLVELATSLDILDGLRNVTNSVDFQVIEYALVMQYGYVTKEGLQQYSDTLKMLTFVLQAGLPGKLASKVICVVDVYDEKVEQSKEKELYKQIIQMTKQITNIKKVV